MDINAKEVEQMFKESLMDEGYKEGDDVILVEGVHANVGFSPKNLEKYEEKVVEFLNDLDEKFFEGTGDGYSFLHVPFDKEGHQWGEQRDGDRLMMLGIALGYVEYLMPKMFWGMLPGSVPYYVIHKEKKEVKISKVTADML